jgi:DNA-binding IclR family transcriptional regulator
LFGCRFPLVSVSAPPHAAGGGHAFVAYRDRMLLKIPVVATSLAPPQPVVPPTKLTREALEELIALTRDSGVMAWPSAPNTSGGACPTTSGARSSTTSPRSSRR